MPDIKFVIFDMDQVLYDYDHQLRLRLLEQLTGRPADQIDAAVWGGPHEEIAEAGTPDTAEGYLAQFAELLEYPIDFDTWADIRRRMMRERPGVLELAREVSVATDIAMLTNNGMMLKAALPVCAPELVKIFGEKSHVSAEFRSRKPDPGIYRLICEKYGHLPEQSAFIDDRAENIEGAEQAGLVGHIYISQESLKAFLLQHDLLPSGENG